MRFFGDWELISDRKWLSFAISQIIDNAVKYSKTDGTIIISISDGNIVISDDGIGILEEDLPRLLMKVLLVLTVMNTKKQPV